MDTLRSLLVQNQTNLDRLRARVRYLHRLISTTDFDTHKQYGPYAEFWDEWQELAASILSDARSDVGATMEFIDELRDFIYYAEAQTNKRKSKVFEKRCAEMDDLAREALVCQRDMLHMADTRIAEHREFTDKLHLVEAIDSLNED